MTKKRTIIYGLLLIGLIALLTAGLLPGETYARYNACTSWNTVIHAASDTMPIMNGETKQLAFPVSDPHAAVCVLEKLQSDGTYAVYTGADLDVSTEGENILVEMVDTLPAAGTYRLILTWNNEDTTQEQVVTFFISYSGN